MHVEKRSQSSEKRVKCPDVADYGLNLLGGYLCSSVTYRRFDVDEMGITRKNRKNLTALLMKA